MSRHTWGQLTAQDLHHSCPDKINPNGPLFQEQIYAWVSILETEGYLSRMVLRKHILTLDELDQVMWALWTILVPPVERLTMGLVLTLEEIAGLRPNEWSRLPIQGKDDTSVPSKQTSSFLWEDAKLTFEEFVLHNRRLEPKFHLFVEWKEGKGRLDIGKVLKSHMSSQTPEASHHCPLCWIIASGMWLDIFEEDVDCRF